MTGKKADYNEAQKELKDQIDHLTKLREDLVDKIPDLSDLDMAIEALTEQYDDVVKAAEEIARNTHIIEMKIDGILYRLDGADGETVATFLDVAKHNSMEVAEDLSPTQKMRAWLIENDYNPGARGQIPKHLREKYEAAHAAPATTTRKGKGARNATISKSEKALQAVA